MGKDFVLEKSEVNKLLDISFQILILSRMHNDLKKMDEEKICQWARTKYCNAGFIVEPVGSLYGYLTDIIK